MKDISHKISSESLPRSDKIRFQGCKKLMNMKWDGIIPPHTHVFWCLLVTLPWPRYLDTDDHYQLCDASWTQWMKNIMIQINPQIHGFALKSIKKTTTKSLKSSGVVCLSDPTMPDDCSLSVMVTRCACKGSLWNFWFFCSNPVVIIHWHFLRNGSIVEDIIIFGVWRLCYFCICQLDQWLSQGFHPQWSAFADSPRKASFHLHILVAPTGALIYSYAVLS